MTPRTITLKVQIVRFVDEYQPGWVACELVDALGETHTFVDKVPIFTTEDLDASSPYPRPGRLTCQLVAERSGPGGRRLFEVDTQVPLGIESTRGESRFVVEPPVNGEDDGDSDP